MCLPRGSTCRNRDWTPSIGGLIHTCSLPDISLGGGRSWNFGLVKAASVTEYPKVKTNATTFHVESMKGRNLYVHVRLRALTQIFTLSEKCPGILSMHPLCTAVSSCLSMG